MSVKTDRFSADDRIGRTVVIRSGPDDFHPQPPVTPERKLPAV